MKPDITVFWKQDYINNGNFADGADFWSLGDGWSIARNIATCSGKQSSYSTSLVQGVSIPAGTYLVAYEVQNYESDGIVWVIIDYEVGHNYGEPRRANGIYYETVVLTSDAVAFRVEGKAGFAGNILHVSITQIDSLPLDTKYIKEIDNLRRDIEDDLFTFKSDTISFVIKNYTQSGYFSPINFLSQSEKIFRLDMTFYLDSGDKSMRYFVNNDGSVRNKLPAKDYITVTGYELSTLFKDNGWYLGEILQIEDEEAKYKFSTGGDKPINEFILSIETDTKKLIAKYKIPIDNSLVNFEDMIFDNVETYSGQFPELEGKQIIDYVITGENWAVEYRNRVFILVKEDDDHAGVYEIKNGELKEVYIWEVLNLGSLECFPEDLAFIHQNEQENPQTLRVYRIWLRTSGSQFNVKMIWFEFDKVEELQHKNSVNNGTYFIIDRYNLKNLYVMSDGSYSGNGDIDNHTYILDNPIIDFNEIIGYDVEPISTIEFKDPNSGNFWILDSTTQHYEQVYYHYYDLLIYDMYRFLRHLNQVFINQVVSDIIKELCILEDNVWYLDYENGITVKFNDRKPHLGGGKRLSEKNVGKEGTIIRKIKFDDLSSQIFTARKERMLDLINYYNGKYGKGKGEKNLEMWGSQNYNLGEKIIRNSFQWMVKNIEWEDKVISKNKIKKRTYSTLFQLGKRIWSEIQKIEDKLVLSDKMTAIGNYTRGLQDSLGLSDDIVRKHSFCLQDLLNLSDEITTEITQGIIHMYRLRDSFNLSDEVWTEILEIDHVLLHDSLGLSDEMVAEILEVSHIRLGDSFSLSDDIATEIWEASQILLYDSFSLSDDIATVISRIRNLQDSLGLSDDIITDIIAPNSYLRNLQDSLGLSDDIITDIIAPNSYLRNLQDSLGLSDDIITIYLRNLQDSFSLSDEMTTFYIHNFSDNILLSDTINSSIL